MEAQIIVRGLSLAAALALAAVGLLCIARPIVVQAYVLRPHPNNWAWKVNPFRHWMRRPSYTVYSGSWGYSRFFLRASWRLRPSRPIEAHTAMTPARVRSGWWPNRKTLPLTFRLFVAEVVISA